MFCDIELFLIEERRGYFIMGRGRRGIIEQSRRKPKRLEAQRGTSTGFAIGQKRKINEIPVPEHVVNFMKNMNPQQLVDFLYPNDDDWYVKTSSVNASGN